MVDEANTSRRCNAEYLIVNLSLAKIKTVPPNRS